MYPANVSPIDTRIQGLISSMFFYVEWMGGQAGPTLPHLVQVLLFEECGELVLRPRQFRPSLGNED